MKEKITAFLTLGCIFSLFFYYKIYSPTNEVSSNATISHEEEVVNKLAGEIKMEKQDDSILISSNDEVLLQDQSCLINQYETDDMTFSDAFKYYRSCNGNDSSFTWKNNKYTTLFASELNLNESLIVSDENTKNEVIIDKYHFELQKEIVGVSQDK